MAATSSTSLSLSLPPLIFILKPKPPHQKIIHTHKFSSSFFHFTSPPSSKTSLKFQNPPHAIPQNTNHLWGISVANSEDIVITDTTITTTPLENAGQIITTTSDDSVSTIVSSLLLIAFIGLSILTIGVIYIAVTDFLQNREKDKFEKEEAAKKNKGGKKAKVKPRPGPKGFGQKIDVDDDFED